MLLPTSNALAEATPDSLGELFSRAPPYPTPDLDRIVTILREQRERNAAAESTGSKGLRPLKVPRPVVPIDPLTSLVI